MSKLIIFILTIISFPLFGQNEIRGVVLDSLTNEPIPFATISYNDTLKTTSDFDGAFQLEPVFGSRIILKVKSLGYYPKDFEVKFPLDSLKLTIQPIPLSDIYISNFIIWGRATDTVFYSNGKIQKINYGGGDIEEFYSNGTPKSLIVNGSTRTWFENGQLRSQSILKNSHYRIETTWYSNGQKETEGTLSWIVNDKTNEGEWVKNNDWKYWTDDGKEKNNR